MGRIGKYNSKSFITYEKIMDGMNTYTPNKVYKNVKNNIYYFINTHGYMHILKPCTVKMDGKILYYAIEDFMLTKDNMLCSKGWSGKFATIQDAVKELETMAVY